MSITDDATIRRTRSEGGATVVRVDAIVIVTVGGYRCSNSKKAPPPLRPWLSLCLIDGSVNKNGIRNPRFQASWKLPLSRHLHRPTYKACIDREGIRNCSRLEAGEAVRSGRLQCTPGQCFKLGPVCSVRLFSRPGPGNGGRQRCFRQGCWNCDSRLQGLCRRGAQCLHGCDWLRCSGQFFRRSRKNPPGRCAEFFLSRTHAACFGTRAIAIGFAT